MKFWYLVGVFCFSFCYSLPNTDKKAKIDDDLTNVLKDIGKLQDEVNDLLEDENKRVKRSTDIKTLWIGETLPLGSRMVDTSYSGDGDTDYYKAGMQQDGNFVVYHVVNGVSTPLWSTNTKNIDGGLKFQTDSNLCLYNTDGDLVWQSYSDGAGTKKLRLGTDGRLVMTTNGNPGDTKWATPYLLPGTILYPGDHLWNGEWSAKMNYNGRFAIRNKNLKNVCNTGSYDKTDKLDNGLKMNTRGNIFIKDNKDNVLWSGDTGRGTIPTNEGDKLWLTQDKTLQVIYSGVVYATCSCNNNKRIECKVH